jgi:type I restriction enzyme S subunit
MKLLELFKELTLHPKNAEELKGLILQLAIQGKLTSKWREEHPNVEEASFLLKRIVEERSTLPRSGRKQNNKFLLPISKEEIQISIPHTWVFCRLGDIIKISSGNGLTSANMNKSGTIPVYGGNGITGWHDEGNVAEKTIVIGRVGYYCGSIHVSEEIAWVTDNAFVTQFSTENIYFDFLFWLLKGTNLKEDENATAQPVISGRKVYPIIVAIPPLEEQKAIVEVVNQLFAEVEQLETLTKERIQLKEDFVVSALQRLSNGDTAKEWSFLQEHFKTFFTEKSNVKKLREAVLQLAVQGKLTTKWRSANPNVEPASELLKRIKTEKEQLVKEKKIKKEKPLPAITKDEIPYGLPDGWQYSRVANVATIKGGKRIPKGYNLSDIPSPYFYIRVTDMKNGSVNLNGLKYISKDVHEIIKAYTISKNDLYITIAGTIGDVGEVPTELDGMNLTENAAKIVFYKVDKFYLKALLRSNVCQNQFLGKVNQMAQPKLALHRIGSTIIPIPPIEEQKAIVEKVNALMGLCDALEQEITKNNTQVQDLMRSCLREVLEG